MVQRRPSASDVNDIVRMLIHILLAKPAKVLIHAEVAEYMSALCSIQSQTSFIPEMKVEGHLLDSVLERTQAHRALYHAYYLLRRNTRFLT